MVNDNIAESNNIPICDIIDMNVSEVTTRTCKKCGRELNITEFPINGLGYSEWTCVYCKREKMRDRYAKMKTEFTEYYWIKRIRSLQQNAKRRHLSFNLTVEQLKECYARQDNKCWYTGEPLVNGSFDRIDVTKGYSVDNVIVCEKYVNTFRQDMSREEFINLCVKIAKHRGSAR